MFCQAKAGLSRRVFAACFALISLGAYADPRGEHNWHGDMRYFHVHDYPHWREGNWYHGLHEGRMGWWWIAAGMWYFYPAPVYPYPDPYTPPPAVVESAPAPTTTVPPPAQHWYYCNSSHSYYPYVSACPEGWKQVPAQPGQ